MILYVNAINAAGGRWDMSTMSDTLVISMRRSAVRSLFFRVSSALDSDCPIDTSTAIIASAVRLAVFGLVLQGYLSM